MGQQTDIAIIGGGIAGVAVAQFAQAAGYSVCLLERHDIGGQTSANSSKLIHGGLRYLESGQLHLVFKSLRDRRKLLKLAPSLVKPVPFTIPIYENSQRQAWQIRLGLSLYALLSGFEPLGRFHSIPNAKWHTLNGLKTTGLKAVFQYWDAQTQDQKLTQAVALSAQSLGAQIITQANCTKLTFKDKLWHLSYAKEGITEEIQAAMVINAAGPWVNEVLAGVLKDTSQPLSDALTIHAPLPIDWIQGSHILLAIPAPTRIFYLESQLDKRVIFVMPWKGHTLIGTTETQRPSLSTPFTPLATEIDYLLQIYRHYFPTSVSSHQALAALVIDTFCGVRVLPKASGSVFSRRRDTLIIPHTPEPRLLSIYGGKLTTFRDTAKQALTAITAQLGPRKAIADVDKLELKAP
jgi:glycerol-3-phosphate dehydrogenase